jgi:hypothetical protein
MKSGSPFVFRTFIAFDQKTTYNLSGMQCASPLLIMNHVRPKLIASGALIALPIEDDRLETGHFDVTNFKK